MKYELPEPTPCGYIAKTEYFYTAEQMQAAYAAGLAARDEEIALFLESWDDSTITSPAKAAWMVRAMAAKHTPDAPTTPCRDF